MKTKKSQNIQIGFLLLPGILIFGFFTIYPIVKLFITSFFKWDFGSMFDQEFIGFANYKEVLTDPYFHLAFSNSIVYTLVTVPAQMILGLLIAMLINNINKFSISYRVAYYLPVITSWVIASLVFKYVFNTEGLLNYFLTKVIHLTSGNIHWLDSRWGGMSVAMLLGTWKGIGWSAIIYIAGISGIDQQLYEAATVDGAGRFQRMWHITVPGLIPTFCVLLLMSIANVLSNGMDQYLVFKNATNATSIRVLDLYVYELGIGQGSIPLTTVVSMLKSVISVTLLFLANSASKLIRGESIV